MKTGFLQSNAFFIFSTVLIASVWVVFGLYCKILNRVPRHRSIVERVLGKSWGWIIVPIGIGEVLLGAWVLTHWQRPACALVQTLVIVTMNTLEIIFARDLLLSAPRMIGLNSLLLGFIWNWALAQRLN